MTASSAHLRSLNPPSPRLRRGKLRTTTRQSRIAAAMAETGLPGRSHVSELSPSSFAERELRRGSLASLRRWRRLEVGGHLNHTVLIMRRNFLGRGFLAGPARYPQPLPQGRDLSSESANFIAHLHHRLVSLQSMVLDPGKTRLEIRQPFIVRVHSLRAKVPKLKSFTAPKSCRWPINIRISSCTPV